MKLSLPNHPEHPDLSTQAVLEWLAHVDHNAPEQAGQLGRQMLVIRSAPIPSTQRSGILDLFYNHIERLLEEESVEFHKITLPVSRRLRHRAKELQELLGALAQDYLNTLAELYDPLLPHPHRPPSETLLRILQCIVWNIHVSHLVASPIPMGLWLELHGALSTARRLGLLEPDGQKNKLTHLYLSAVLTAIAQPASFNSQELEFISQYLRSIDYAAELLLTPPKNNRAVFWIDPKTDSPAHATTRRPTPADTEIWFFSGKELAEHCSRRLKSLSAGRNAIQLGLPPLADNAAGQSVLSRLVTLWGNPSKRLFPRRRQPYRAKISIGLEHLWQLTKTPGSPPATSEWMVTNESPNGYAIMHISGPANDLQVGNIVALLAEKDAQDKEVHWQICLIRWAISENPEHIELGLQLLASRVMAAEIAQPAEPQTGTVNALFIPEMPPLRPAPAIVLKSGQLASQTHKFVLMIEKGNLEIREFHPLYLDEQSNRVEVFSVEPDVAA